MLVIIVIKQQVGSLSTENGANGLLGANAAFPVTMERRPGRGHARIPFRRSVASHAVVYDRKEDIA